MQTRWIATSILLVGLGFISGGCKSTTGQTTNLFYQQALADASTRTVADVPQTQPAEVNRLPVIGENEGLSEYLAYAALNNPALEAAFNEWKAAIERIPQVRSLPDPRFTYKYFIEEVETRVGPQQQAIQLAQTFPWLSKLKLRGDMARESANAARQRYEGEKLRLFYRIRKSYAEYYFLGKAVDVTRENRKLVIDMERVARARYKTAKATHAEVIRAQVELGKIDDQLQQLLDLRAPLVADLNAAMNRPIGENLPWPKMLSVEDIKITDEKIMALCRGHNPDLKAMDHQIAREQYGMDLAKKAYFPDITLTADYIDVGPAVRPSAQGLRAPFAQRSALRLAQGNGDLLDVVNIPKSFIRPAAPSDSGKDVWAIGISLNIPIWYDTYRAGEREALANYYAAMNKKTAAEKQLGADIKRAIYLFRDAKRKIDLYGDTLIPKAEESLKATEAAYRTGKSTFLDLIDAERVLLEFQLAYHRAVANREQSLSELDMLAGQHIPRKNTPENNTLR